VRHLRGCGRSARFHHRLPSFVVGDVQYNAHTRIRTAHTEQRGLMQESRQRRAKVGSCEGYQNKWLRKFRWYFAASTVSR
jgi:hypothetical protein